MRKYAEIAKILFKAQIAYRFDVAMAVLFTISKILFAYILWGAIFGQNETIAGFTFPMMVSYYIISSFLSQIEMSDGVSGEIGDRIRGGTFSKYMVVPVNTQGYFIAQTFGAMAFYLIFKSPCCCCLGGCVRHWIYYNKQYLNCFCCNHHDNSRTFVHDPTQLFSGYTCF